MATQLKMEAPPEVVEEQTPANDPPERNYEAEAREAGWKPEGEFADGEKRPHRFKTAEEFVRDAETILPLVNKENSKLKREVDELKGVVKRLAKAEQLAYQSGIEAARAEMREAAQAGDMKAFDAAEKKVLTLQKEAGEPAGRADPRPAFNAFREANDWYDLGNQPGASDVERRARVKADQIADRLVTEGLHEQLTPTEFFERIAEETRAALPQLDAKPARQKPASDVAAPTRGGNSRTARTGANLPPEAKEHAERYMRAGIFKVKTPAEAYDMMAKSFDWDGWAKAN